MGKQLMYLALGHHSVHGAEAAWTPVSWQPGVVESSVEVVRFSGDADATAESVGLPVAGSTYFRSD